MNNKILSIKRTSAIFLATVLVAGTIALSSPSSFMVGAQALPQYGIENGYGSYEQPGYGMDRYEKPSYGNDYYEQQTEYPSYQPDYKPEYPSDNSYKSKKDSSSVSINKLNCINVNNNINGDVIGNVSVGNSGKSATGEGTDEGYVGVGSSGENGEGYKGYNKQKDKGFECIINNNNNNVINVGVGNETTPEPLTCEECFREFLTQPQINAYVQLNLVPTLERLCDIFFNNIISESRVIADLTSVHVGVSNEDAQNLVDCLKKLGVRFGT